MTADISKKLNDCSKLLQNANNFFNQGEEELSRVAYIKLIKNCIDEAITVNDKLSVKNLTPLLSSVDRWKNEFNNDENISIDDKNEINIMICDSFLRLIEMNNFKKESIVNTDILNNIMKEDQYIISTLISFMSTLYPKSINHEENKTIDIFPGELGNRMSIIYVELIILLCSLLRLEGNFESCFTYIKEGEKVCEKNDLHKDIIYAKLVMCRCLTLRIIGVFRVIPSYYDQAIEIIINVLGDSDHNLATIYYELACVLNIQHNYSNALLYINKSVDIYTKNKDTNIILVNCAKAKILANMGSFNDALHLINPSIDLLKLKYGDKHPIVALNLIYEADIIQDKGFPNDAINVYIEANDIIKRGFNNYEMYNRYVSLSVYSLAKNAFDRGSFSEACVLHEEALDMRIKYLKTTKQLYDIDVAESQIALAAIYCEIGRIKESILLLSKAEMTISHVFGNNNIMLAYVYYLTGKILHIEGKYKLAKDQYDKCLAFVTDKVASDHPILSQIYYSMSESVRIPGYYKEALKLCDTSIEMRRKYLKDDSHPLIAFSLYQRGIVLRDSNQSKKSLILLYQSLKIVSTRLGASHFLLAEILSNIGDCNRSLNNYDDAAQELLDSIHLLLTRFDIGEDSVKKMVTNDPETFSNLFNTIKNHIENDSTNNSCNLGGIFSVGKIFLYFALLQMDLKNPKNAMEFIVKLSIPFYKIFFCGDNHPCIHIANLLIGRCMNMIKENSGDDIIKENLYYFSHSENVDYSDNHPILVYATSDIEVVEDVHEKKLAEENLAKIKIEKEIKDILEITEKDKNLKIEEEKNMRMEEEKKLKKQSEEEEEEKMKKNGFINKEAEDTKSDEKKDDNENLSPEEQKKRIMLEKAAKKRKEALELADKEQKEKQILIEENRLKRLAENEAKAEEKRAKAAAIEAEFLAKANREAKERQIRLDEEKAIKEKERLEKEAIRIAQEELQRLEDEVEAARLKEIEDARKAIEDEIRREREIEEAKIREKQEAIAKIKRDKIEEEKRKQQLLIEAELAREKKEKEDKEKIERELIAKQMFDRGKMLHQESMVQLYNREKKLIKLAEEKKIEQEKKSKKEALEEKERRIKILVSTKPFASIKAGVRRTEVNSSITNSPIKNRSDALVKDFFPPPSFLRETSDGYHSYTNFPDINIMSESFEQIEILSNSFIDTHRKWASKELPIINQHAKHSDPTKKTIVKNDNLKKSILLTKNLSDSDNLTLNTTGSSISSKRSPLVVMKVVKD